MTTYVFSVEIVTLWVTVKFQDFVTIFNYVGNSKQNIIAGSKIVLCTQPQDLYKNKYFKDNPQGLWWL